MPYLPVGLFVEFTGQFCSGRRQDFRKSGGIETLDEFRYETEWQGNLPNKFSDKWQFLLSRGFIICPTNLRIGTAQPSHKGSLDDLLF